VIPTVATLASVIKSRRDPSARAHAGSLRGHPPAEASAEPLAGRPDTRPTMR
jgi:tellurite resistance protein TerC